VTATVVAFVCSAFAAGWALRQLYLVGTALHFQPRTLARLLRPGAGADAAKRLDRAMQTDRDAWESEMVSQIVRAPTAEEAQAEVNAVLLDVDGKLEAATKVYAACARIAVFGCLMGAALLFMAGKGLTVAVIDVFAIGAAGVLVSLAAGKEAKRLVKSKRAELDDWVESLVRSQWTHQG